MEVQANLVMNHARVEDHTDSFQELFTTYYPFVVRQIMRIVKDQQTAEDIAQDVFLSFYHTDRTGIEHIPAWLSKSALYAAYNYLRSEKRRYARQERSASEQEHVSPSSEEMWLAKESQSIVRDVLEELDERERTLLVMKYSGFPYAELAKATGTQISSVGTLLARAKSKFRTIYGRMRGEEE
ncbi:RNA polymerase sigma factor SigX [Brevibacillus sp. M2.1A]|uniref:RNA polymerase sigma factor SigX n=2 Tax=Brevibacillus TaxID=55080 RepID=UPI00156A7EF8|nr:MULTISPECIES: RNA polymerase sigma factor SigX [Brevibacillus]MCE0450938.1 RNA polymerase sigma factor SigX [Brevibacillus sp. AF8]MCM3142839.1 RNA polymerase sigma factor SigX [Brevibacillus sp. MER 51]MBY0086577.1 sigma-70 family RNA polymerase sigma factor [Brevibacillus brevis]MCC8437603.1 RNA polymerase sigma factor SigX [Brevibacillus sp. M2.1A]UKK99730.1 sigma-70 family RNA polymerase sigma factor [Brevibacillus brevis]